jgi:hypothetical protein
LFKRFHPRINLTTLFLTKTYLLNTIKPFLSHENWSLGPNSKTPKNLSLVATLRNLNYKILSMQDIKLAQMRPGAKISALKVLWFRRGTNFCPRRRRLRMTDENFFIAFFFHVLWLLSVKTWFEQKKNFKIFGMQAILSLIYFIYAESNK